MTQAAEWADRDSNPDRTNYEFAALTIELSAPWLPTTDGSLPEDVVRVRCRQVNGGPKKELAHPGRT